MLSDNRQTAFRVITVPDVTLLTATQSPTRVLKSRPIDLTRQEPLSQPGEARKAGPVHAILWSDAEGSAQPQRDDVAERIKDFQTSHGIDAALIQRKFGTGRSSRSFLSENIFCLGRVAGLGLETCKAWTFPSGQHIHRWTQDGI